MERFVLVVEDDESLAHLMCRQLIKAKFLPIAVTGFLSLKPFVAMTQTSLLALDINSVDMVLLDGNIKGKFQGVEVAEFFAKCGKICISTSSDLLLRDLMIQAGCKLGYDKSQVVSVITSLIKP